MPIVKYHDTVADSATGRPVANVSVVITDYHTGAVATVFNEDGSVAGAPVVTDRDGYFSAYLTPGRYNLSVSRGTIERKYSDIVVLPALPEFLDAGGSGKRCVIQATCVGLADDEVTDIWNLEATTL